jgi:phenylalanyl-tRNA synthetase alpha subunit
VSSLPYHKNKQQAFQAAQQGMKDVVDVYTQIEKSDADYGKQLKHLKQEVNEAYQQIQNALEVASEKERLRLEQYERDLRQMVNEVNDES